MKITLLFFRKSLLPGHMLMKKLTNNQQTRLLTLTVPPGKNIYMYVHPPCRYFTDRLREHILPTALSDVVHPLSGTHWTLKHYSVALLVDLNADLKHYFSVRHSVARLELSASASEVIRHAGAVQIRLLLLLLLWWK